MTTTHLPFDPFNIIITGVGGQGNVMASRILGNMLAFKDLHVTIGETFGASQRGGSVMSHVRVSAQAQWSPQIPKGKAHVLLAMEPVETLRVLKDYGNPEIYVICNERPIHPVGVISGQQKYPEMSELRKCITELSAKAWFIQVTEAAMELGHPIFGNIMMIAALAGVKVLPLDRADFETVVSRNMTTDKAVLNLKAFDMGRSMVSDHVH